MAVNKLYYIWTFGCQANIADSGKLGEKLEGLGFERFIPMGLPHGCASHNDDRTLEEVLRNVQVLVVNTCSVRQKSEDKVYGMGKMIKKIREEGNNLPTIILTGCMVGSTTGERKRIEFDKLKSKTPWVDIYLNDPSYLNELFSAHDAFSAPGKPNDFDEWGYVNISNGCDNFCTYCVVPYARGRERSRTTEDILADVCGQIDQGHNKIMLCGQNVNSWGLSMGEKFKIRAGQSRPTPFADLLKTVHDLPGVLELAFISSNPFDFTAELINTLSLPKMSKYLHIAVQSGSNEVLSRMNRRHTVEEFVSLIERIRQIVPDVELGTDAIVGFPGETRDQFMETVKLFERGSFKVAFISMYSPREGTVAARLYSDDVPLSEKKYRHAYLTKVWRESLRKK